MSGNLNIVLAFIAGLLSFLSPCVLPLIPSFLSFIGGISYRDLAEKRSSRWGIFGQTLLFVLGFSAVFIGLGVLFSGTAGFLGGAVQAGRVINLAAGGVVILLGLNYIFNFWSLLSREKRLHLARRPAGGLGSALLGMAFAAGWTPCVGPILASILLLAGSSGQLLRGTLMLAVYSAGLGLPFLLAGLFFTQFARQTERLKPRLNAIRIASGVFLILIGLLILLGRLQRLNVLLFRLAGGLQAWAQADPVLVRVVLSGVFLLPALWIGYTWARRVFGFRAASGPAPAAKPSSVSPAPSAAPAAGEQPIARSAVTSLFPWRLALFALLLAVGIFGLVGLIDVSRLFTFWFTYQGI